MSQFQTHAGNTPVIRPLDYLSPSSPEQRWAAYMCGREVSKVCLTFRNAWLLQVPELFEQTREQCMSLGWAARQLTSDPWRREWITNYFVADGEQIREWYYRREYHRQFDYLVHEISVERHDGSDPRREVFQALVQIYYGEIQRRLAVIGPHLRSDQIPFVFLGLAIEELARPVDLAANDSSMSAADTFNPRPRLAARLREIGFLESQAQNLVGQEQSQLADAIDVGIRIHLGICPADTPPVTGTSAANTPALVELGGRPDVPSAETQMDPLGASTEASNRPSVETNSPPNVEGTALSLPAGWTFDSGNLTLEGPNGFRKKLGQSNRERLFVYLLRRANRPVALDDISRVWREEGFGNVPNPRNTTVDNLVTKVRNLVTPWNQPMLILGRSKEKAVTLRVITQE